MAARTSVIVAVGKDRVIGGNNGLLWHIPEDLKHFKRVTDGHPVIMGRNTFDSLPEKFRPLPGRTNIVVTRNTDWTHDGVEVAHSLEDAIELANKHDQKEIFVMGGAQIYEQALPFADRLYITEVEAAPEGDVFFPAYEEVFTKVIDKEPHPESDPPYTFVTLTK